MKRVRSNRKGNKKEGQSLVEIMAAIAFFVAGGVTVAYLIFGAFDSFAQSVDRTKAVYLAKEGLVAATALGRSDFDLLSTGVHGMSLTGNGWEFSSTSDITGKFTRNVTVTDVEDKIKQIESTVSWTTINGREQTETETEYVTDIRQTEGDGGNLTVDISGATLSSSSTELLGLIVENTGDDPITLTDIETQWNNAETLYGITIGGSDVYSVATSSGVSSGTEVDVSDVTLAPGSGLTSIDRLSWNGSMTGAEFLLTFIFSDGSRKHTFVEI